MSKDKTEKKLQLSIHEDRIKDLDVSEAEIEGTELDPEWLDKIVGGSSPTMRLAPPVPKGTLS